MTTIMSAETLGIQQDVGSTEVGKIADLIILNKNPLDDIHNSREIRHEGWHFVRRQYLGYSFWPFYKKYSESRLKSTD